LYFLWIQWHALNLYSYPFTSCLNHHTLFCGPISLSIDMEYLLSFPIQNKHHYHLLFCTNGTVATM
jgi:hypothetical protein